MRNAPLLTLLLASLTAWPQQAARPAAQTASPSQTMPTLLKPPVVSEGCPISFFAERRPIGLVGYASDTEARRHHTGVELTFKRSETPRIVSASVTVHGTSARPRITPAGTNPDEDLTETFDLERQAGTPTLQTTELWMKKLANVRWVELTGLEYVDGSAWHPSSTSRCNATPNGVLLVAFDAH